jgi:hypothetical protein
MATIMNYVVAVAGWDNRQPIDGDVANQLIVALSNEGYNARAVTVKTLVQATMTNPTGGTNQINIQLESPAGITDSTIIVWVTAAILGLDLPTAPAITVTAVTVF